MNERIAIENLKEINLVCREYCVVSWLQDGTLLGIIRDKKLIPWDNDTDMGCHEKNWDSRVSESLKSRGFSIDNRKNVGPRFTKNGVSTDIFLYRDENHGGWSWSAYKGRKEYRFDMPKFRVKNKLIWGEIFYIPENPEWWLEVKYGKDWKVPKQRWDYASDPANSRLV